MKIIKTNTLNPNKKRLFRKNKIEIIFEGSLEECEAKMKSLYEELKLKMSTHINLKETNCIAERKYPFYVNYIEVIHYNLYSNYYYLITV